MITGLTSDCRKWNGYCAVILSLLLPALISSPAFGQRIYGRNTDKNYVRISGNTKIPREMARQVKVRDGYAPDEKRVVVGFLIPPELGGVADFNNLTALPKKEAKQRKEVEKKILKQVKHGQMSIGDARSRIVYWKAYQNAPDTGVKIRR
ncbi:MAG TPA: hypothetical protein VGL91_15785 [Acidobacteriota bacterium]|jgi:hypothetical protein